MHFESRKNVLQYDDVINKQRELIYGQRNMVIDGGSIRDNIINMINAFSEDVVARFTAEGAFPDDWDLDGLVSYLCTVFLKPGELAFSTDDKQDMTRESLTDTVYELALAEYERKTQEFTPEKMQEFERYVLLKVVDVKWRDHIDEMEQLKHGIWLRSYGQKDPVIEYRNIASDIFADMVESIKIDTATYILRANLEKETPTHSGTTIRMMEGRGSSAGEPKKKVPVTVNKVGRNEPCPCGSGLKYKKCCGK